MAGIARGLGWVLGALLAAPAAAIEWHGEGPELGVVNDLTIDPARPDTVYAATANGGFWRSDDGGRSWRRLSAEVVGGSYRWIEPDRADPQTLWAGDRAGSDSALLRSRDGGATWFVVDGPVTGGELGRLHSTGVRIAFAPSDPKTIFVPSTNLHYRSVDGGASWHDFRVPGQDAYAIAIDPADPKTVYAGGRGEQQHISVSRDGGASWTALGAGLPAKSFRQVLIHPRRPATLYGLVGFNEVWRSDDAGATFAPLPKVVGMSGTDDAELRLDPSDPDRLWLVGEGGIFRGDGAGNWEARSRGTGSWQARALAIDPRDGNRLLAGMAGDGVYRSEDGGASWTPSRSGLHAGWVRRLVAAPGQPGLWAQTSTGLFRRLGDRRWEEVRAPFSRDRAAEPRGLLHDRHAPAQLLAYHGRDLWRSGDGGASWKTALAPPKEPTVRQMMQGIVSFPQPDFVALAQHPADPRRLYAGGDGREPGQAVFASSDGGATWTPSGSGIAGRIDHLLAPLPGVLLAVDRDRALHRSSDDAAGWSQVAAGWPAAKVAGWVVDPSAPERIFVATEQGLYRSTDGGQSWSRHANGLPDVEIDAVAVSPAGTVLAGGSSGLFVSRDHGEQFARLDDELVHVTAIAFGGEPLRLYVGTAVASVQSSAWQD